MTSPLQPAVDNLAAMRLAAVEQVTDPDPRILAALPATAAALGLLAMVVAADEQQLETVRRVIADLQQDDAGAARGLALLALVLCRHLLVESEEAQRVAAKLFQEGDQAAAAATEPGARATARLLAASRLLLLAASWLDADFRHGAAIGQIEERARAAAEQAANLPLSAAIFDRATGLAAAVMLRDDPPEPTGEPLAQAFETLTDTALRLSAGRGA